MQGGPLVCGVCFVCGFPGGLVQFQTAGSSGRLLVGLWVVLRSFVPGALLLVATSFLGGVGLCCVFSEGEFGVCIDPKCVEVFSV